MEFFKQEGCTLVWTKAHETVVLQSWGNNGLRVRATHAPVIRDLPGALLEGDQPQAQIAIQSPEKASIQNGQMRADVTSDGRLVFTNSLTGKILLEEEPFLFFRKPARDYKSRSGDLYEVEVKFLAKEGERLYGLGQHTHGFLDQKGCVIELAQRNTQVSIPFLVSNQGYGFLWNNPAIGRVELGRDLTRWVANATRQIDYAITTADDYAGILGWYADVTGHAPLLPEWGAGFWQCKLRYKTQEELLSIAHEYKRRGLPLSVIVADFFHWTMMGEWQFDPKDWPDPAGMVSELEGLGVKLMISVWATVNPNSRNFDTMNQQGWLVGSERGIPIMLPIDDAYPPGRGLMYYYDATHPEARKFVWEQVRQNYYRYGIKVWWLDACEPEFYPADYDHVRYHLGNGLEVGNLYPLLHEKGFYEGMRAEGETEIISLCRSAWAGSQAYGAAVWSGDIASTFEVLQQQVRAGLNIGLSGIPWWTTDIGGFHGGDITTVYFRELIVRWFQFGVFCPLFRLHGFRSPSEVAGSGGPNEVWSFGEEAYGILKHLLFLRERMKPYLMAQMALASEKGIPVMRPLFFDFPQDLTVYTVEDQFMFGPNVLVAPVLHEGKRQRHLYLPAGEAWLDAWTGQRFAGGQWITTVAPLEKVPVYFREGSQPFLIN